MSEAVHPALPADEPESSSRRALVRLGIGLAGAAYVGAMGYPVYRYLAAPMQGTPASQISEVALRKADLPGPGSATFFKFGSRPALLIHHADGGYVCFDAVCTHLGCTVQFEPQKSRIFCACHGGVYEMHTGAVVSGPPPKPLARFQVEEQDEQIVVSRG
jgi:cytochrome b6-f complex iron-sulfur subunit